MTRYRPVALRPVGRMDGHRVGRITQYPTPPGGHLVYVEVTGTHSATLEAIDETHNSGGTEHYKGTTKTSHQAEWMLERPAIQGRLHGLSATGVHFTSAGAAVSTSKSADKSAGAFTGKYYRMHNCANPLPLADPAPLSNHGFDEVITRRNSGAGDDCAGPQNSRGRVLLTRLYRR